MQSHFFIRSVPAFYKASLPVSRRITASGGSFDFFAYVAAFLTIWAIRKQLSSDNLKYLFGSCLSSSPNGPTHNSVGMPFATNSNRIMHDIFRCRHARRHSAISDMMYICPRHFRIKGNPPDGIFICALLRSADCGKG